MSKTDLQEWFDKVRDVHAERSNGSCGVLGLGIIFAVLVPGTGVLWLANGGVSFMSVVCLLVAALIVTSIFTALPKFLPAEPVHVHRDEASLPRWPGIDIHPLPLVSNGLQTMWPDGEDSYDDWTKLVLSEAGQNN